MIKLRQGGINEDRQAELARLKIVSIRLSSGTTGRSKGIMISEDAIWWRAECNSVMHEVTSGDCIIYLVAMDLASPHLIAYFVSGATVLLKRRTTSMRSAEFAPITALHMFTPRHCSTK